MASIFAIAAASAVDIADVTLFGTSLSGDAFTVAGATISIGSLVAMLAFVGAVYTNETDLDRLPDEYKYAVAATAVLLVGIPTVPGIESFVTGSDWIALGAVTVQSAGYAAVSYLA